MPAESVAIPISLLTSIIAIIVAIYNVYDRGKKNGQLEADLMSKIKELDTKIVSREKENAGIGEKIDLLDKRLQQLERSNTGIDVKIDNFKESMDELKKAFHELSKELTKK